MESAENITLYIQDQMYEFFEKNQLPIFLFHTISKKAVAYNSAFLQKTAHYKHLVSIWIANYSSENSPSTFVEYSKNKFQFLSSNLGEDLLLIQIIEFTQSPTGGGKLTSKQDVLSQKKNSSKAFDFFKEKVETAFLKVFEIAPLGFVFTDADFKVLWSNEKSHQLLGRSGLSQSSFVDAILVDNIDEFWC
ncbi:hypothetical protein C9994_15865, partial [Marivirga lumbricoides]